MIGHDMLPHNMTTLAIAAELLELGEAECACSSAPTRCEDCERYESLQSELADRPSV